MLLKIWRPVIPPSVVPLSLALATIDDSRAQVSGRDDSSSRLFVHIENRHHKIETEQQAVQIRFVPSGSECLAFLVAKWMLASPRYLVFDEFPVGILIC